MRYAQKICRMVYNFISKHCLIYLGFNVYPLDGRLCLSKQNYCSSHQINQHESRISIMQCDTNTFVANIKRSASVSLCRFITQWQGWYALGTNWNGTCIQSSTENGEKQKVCTIADYFTLGSGYIKVHNYALTMIAGLTPNIQAKSYTVHAVRYRLLRTDSRYRLLRTDSLIPQYLFFLPILQFSLGPYAATWSLCQGCINLRG